MRKTVLTAALWLALGAIACDEAIDDDGEGEGEPQELAPLFDGDESLVGARESISVSTADSEPHIVTVPDDGVSFAVVLSGLGSTQAQPATITSPSGEVVFEVGKTRTNRVDAFPHVMTALVPVNPDVAIEPGNWEIVFFADGDANAEVETVVRLDSDVASGTLDLNLHFVGLEELDAETAAEDADFQAIMDGVANTYDAAGIALGEREYFDVDDEALAVITTTPVGTDELLELVEVHSAARDNRAVNIFFVADIEDPSSARSLLGVSAGVPGPPALHGTKRSGVAINMANYLAAVDGGEDLADVQAEIELIVAHELGHYLGLFHTTEANGAELDGPLHGADPLADTPACADDADADGDGVLSSDECSDAGGDNLMFWSPPNGADRLSAGQREVLRRNPVVR